MPEIHCRHQGRHFLCNLILFWANQVSNVYFMISPKKTKLLATYHTLTKSYPKLLLVTTKFRLLKLPMPSFTKRSGLRSLGAFVRPFESFIHVALYANLSPHAVRRVSNSGTKRCRGLVKSLQGLLKANFGKLT